VVTTRDGRGNLLNDYCEFINNSWYLIEPDPEGNIFRTRSGNLLQPIHCSAAGLGYWRETDRENPAYRSPRPPGSFGASQLNSSGSESESEAPASPQNQPDPLADDTLAATVGTIVTLQGSHPLTQEQPPVMAQRISSQIYDLYQQGGSLLPPQLSSQAAPNVPSGLPPITAAASSSSTQRAVHAGSTITAATTAPVNPGTGGLKGLAPSIFYGDRNKSDLFLKEFKQWKLINRNTDEMKEPYNRVLMALAYIKGERVNDWQEEQLNKLESTTHQHTDEAIWQEFEQAFKDAFTDSNKKQRAYERLKNHQMTGDDVDSYISGFENLVKQAGWSRNDAGTMDLFQAGLRHELKKAILNQEVWPTTLDQWERDARNQNSRHKARTALLGQRPGQPSRPSLTQEQLRRGMGLPPRPPQPRRDPYAMDVDNTQVEANAATRAQREKFRREGRCIGCGQFGHFVRNCPRGQPSKRVPQSSGRTQQPNQASGSRPLPQLPRQRQNNWRPPPPAYAPRGAGQGQSHQDHAHRDEPLIDLLDRTPSLEDPAPALNPGAPGEVARHLRGMNQEERERVWDELQREDGEDFP
jgi:hypothetical protein